MKKLISLLAVLFTVFAGIVIATEADLTQKQVRDPRQLAVILDTRTIVQTDAAVSNTVTTGYLPARVGQVLVGKVSAVAAVWVSTSVSTSGWTKVSN
jgi:hypothetical protein